MKTINTLAVAALTASLAVTGFAATSTHKVAKKTVALICPVTHEKIASVHDAVGHSTYKGKTYYFCCPMCKPAFDKNPAKYVK